MSRQIIQFLHIDPLQMVVDTFNVMRAFLRKKITATRAYFQQAVDELRGLRVFHATDSKILPKGFREIQRHLMAAVKEINA
ncbi:MAG: hypothetical protein PHZ02_01065 [Desulfocapsaceae bacterium]|nr:hypothetical protein [Desulfocapsaceae bacterium]